MAEKIIERSSLSMYEEDQAKYSVIANRRRAIPEVRDGLKPVHRKIIYGAYKDGLISPSKKVKSSSVVGLVMKLYYGHGDAALYDSIVSLVAWYKIKYPLMYGKGNWGSMSGSGAAAMRYTECALTNFGYDICIDEISQSKNTVNWIETYHRNGDKEPETLPTKLPLLLINGSFGIGVGMEVSIPSHNINEVISATRALIKNPNQEIVLVPDLPQSCDLIADDWAEISRTGSGSFKARGKIITEQDKKGNYILHIISLPYQVNTTTIYDKILDMVNNKQLPMIKDIYNSLDGENPDITIYLKPGSDPEYVKQIIYAKTKVQDTISVNFEVVDTNGIDIKRYGYREYLLTFISTRMNVKFRLYCNKLQQCMTRYHQVEAFIKVLKSGQIEKIIDMIRKSKSTNDEEIVEFIIKKCGVTDLQAKFIINTNISRLSAGHLKNYVTEANDLVDKINLFKAMVTDDGTLIRKEIDQELEALGKKYDSPRLCNTLDISDENMVPHGIFKIVVTEKNYIRKIPDVDKVNVVKKDNPKFILKVDNADNILIFDNKGKVFNLPISKIPISDKSHPGTDVRHLIRALTSDIIAVFYEPIIKKIAKSNMKHYFAVLTKSNMIKKLGIEDFTSVNPSGLIYSKIKDNDEIVGVQLIPHNLDIIICSGHKALRCKLKSIPQYKRNALGAKAMNTNEPLNGLAAIYPDTSSVIVITRKGKFNKFDINLMNPHERATKGGSVVKLDRDDEIFTILGANEADRIRVLTTEGAEEINVADIKLKSNIAAGVKMLQSKGVILRADVLH